MNEKLDAEIAAIAGSDQKVAEARQIGAYAMAFIAGVMDAGPDFDEAIRVYGTYIEAMSAGNHCCCCTQNKPQS